jgi:hypothetical protein
MTNPLQMCLSVKDIPIAGRSIAGVGEGAAAGAAGASPFDLWISARLIQYSSLIVARTLDAFLQA